MIIKSFELNKIDYKHKFFLLYGENQGHKDEVIQKNFKSKLLNNGRLHSQILLDGLENHLGHAFG